MKKKKKLHSFWFYLAQDAAIVLNWIGTRFAWWPKLRYSKEVTKKTRIIRKRAIIVSNHSSFADPPCICASIPFRRVYVVTAKEMFKKPFAKPLEMIGCIKIDRDITDTVCIRNCLDHLNADKIVTVFPEGKINIYDELAEFKSGAVLLAAMSGSPIIPIYNAGNYKRFQRVQMIMGEPIDIGKLTKGQLNKERIDELTTMLKDKMEALKTELYTQISEKHKATARECRAVKRAKIEAQKANAQEAENGQA